MRILIVDDDAGVGEALTALFRDAGHAVAWAADSDSARRLARAEPPDVLLVDLWLGDELSLPLVADVHAPRSLVITATRPTAAMRLEVTRSGAARLLEKSIDPAELVRSVVLP